MKNWTHEDDELLEAMYKAGKPPPEIAETLGRTVSAVYQRKQTLTKRRYIHEITGGNNSFARGSRFGCDVGNDNINKEDE